MTHNIINKTNFDLHADFNSKIFIFKKTLQFSRRFKIKSLP